jgi:hypothetical protein
MLKRVRGGDLMRDPTVRFALDAVALTRLQEKAAQQGLSLSQLLKNLVYQAINRNQASHMGRKASEINDERRDEQGDR